MHPKNVCTMCMYCACKCICWQQPKFYRQIAGYGMSIGNHLVGRMIPFVGLRQESTMNDNLVLMSISKTVVSIIYYANKYTMINCDSSNLGVGWREMEIHGEVPHSQMPWIKH